MDRGNITIKAFPKSATILVLFSKLVHAALDVFLGIRERTSLSFETSEQIINTLETALELH